MEIDVSRTGTRDLLLTARISDCRAARADTTTRQRILQHASVIPVQQLVVEGRASVAIRLLPYFCSEFPRSLLIEV